MQVANWMCDVLDNIEDLTTIESVKGEVVKLCNTFPVYA
jgi:glycine hydroxymethyltransferase